MRTLLLAFLLLAVGWALVLAAYQPPPPADLTLGYSSLETLDPTRMRASADIRVAYATFEGLTTFDPRTFEVRPGVAERWEASDDYRTWTFHLRPDAKWWNGDPVTAADFLYAWRQNLLPDIAPPYLKFLRYIRGGKAYSDWALKSLKEANGLTDPAQRRAAARARREAIPRKFRELVGARAVDDRTLVVELENPTPFFDEIAGTWPLFPLHRPTMARFTSVDPDALTLRRDPHWTKPGNIMGNGPFELTEWSFKVRLRLRASDHYWNREAVKSETVELRYFKQPYQQYLSYLTGEVDVFIGAALPFNADLLAAAERGERDDVHPVDSFGTYYFSLNCRPTLPDGRENPLADPRVRRALSLVVDKRQIVTQVTRMNQNVSDVFVRAEGIPGYDAPKGLPCLSDAPDEAARQRMIERARGLLAEAGYEDPAAMPPIELIYNSGQGHGLTVQAMAEMWRDALGVEVRTDVQEWKVYLGRRQDGRFMVARSGWFGDYGDPTTFLDLFQSDNGNNDTGLADEKYDAMLAEVAEMTDPDARLAKLARAEEYLLNELVPILPLYQYRTVHLYDADRVTGVSTHPRNLQFYHQIEVRPE